MPEANDPTLGPGQQITDWKAFTEVFHRYYASLARYACRITGDADAAADVLQDVFLKLWEDRERLVIEVSLKALLYTTVRNRALNVNRRRQHFTSDVAVDDLVDQREAGSVGGERMAAETLRQHLSRWIDELPPRRKEAFTLSRYHDLTHGEIAKIMGLSQRTVDTHIFLALRELRGRLDALQNEGI